jgi:AAA15 family ATPase/GTPase
MLEALHIQGFRLFDEFKVDNLARVNLIVGKNNVGKSSLLEAVYLLVNQTSPKVLFELLDMRGEVSYSNELLTSGGYEIAHLFFGHQLQNGSTIQIEGSGEKKLSLAIAYFSRWEQMANEIANGQMRRQHSSSLRFTYDDLISDLAVFGELIDRKQRLYDDVAVSPSRSSYITATGVGYDQLARLWDRITLTPKEDVVITMLQVLDANVERISFQSRQTSKSGILVKHEGEERPIPLGSMGDGMYRVLTIAVAMANSENGYLLVDEIDTGLHYGTISDMWRLVFETAARLNIQVFATTHSWDCVESFAEALDMQPDEDAGALFRLERQNGHIAAVRYSAEELEFVRSQSIRNVEVR